MTTSPSDVRQSIQGRSSSVRASTRSAVTSLLQAAIYQPLRIMWVMSVLESRLKAPVGIFITVSAHVKAPVSRKPEIVRARILDAAKAEFMEFGFARASSNRILQRFGGSKSTMFRYFPSMQALFKGVVERIAGSGPSAIDTTGLDEDCPESWLNDFSFRAAEWLLSDDNIFVGRMAIAEGHLFPEVQAVYVGLALAPMHTAVARRLLEWDRAGRVFAIDPQADAEKFIDLCVSGLIARRLYRSEESFDLQSLKQHVTRCVEIYLKGVACPCAMESGVAI